MYGADVAELEALGQRMAAGAQQLDHIRNQLRALLGHDAWRGGDAAMYRALWTGTYEGHLARAASGLRETAQGLRRNARQQQNASSSESSGTSGHAAGGRSPNSLVMPGVLAGVSITSRRLAWFYDNVGAFERGDKAIPEDLVKKLPGLPWAMTTGKAEVVRLKGTSAAEQTAWWNGLSDDQRAALLFAYPSMLLALTGLPSDAVATARKQFSLSMVDRIARDSEQQSMSGAVHLGVVDVGAEAKASIDAYKDHAEVTLTLTGDLGKQFGAGHATAGVGVEGGVAVTYKFLSVQDAQDFVNGLKDRLAPDLLRSIAHDGATDYLRMNGWARESTVATLAVTGTAAISLGGVSAHVSGSAGGTYNFDTHDRTLFVEMGGGASVAAGGASLGGDLSGKVSLQLDPQGHITGATVSGTLSSHGEMSSGDLVKSITGTDLPAEVAATQGKSVSFSSTVNVQDPAVQSYLLRLAQNPSDGSALKGLLAGSEAQITVTATTSTTSSLDLGLVSGKYSTSSGTTTSALAKPGGGPWVSVPTT